MEKILFLSSLLFWVFITWIGTETVPTLVEVAEEEDGEEDNDDVITVLTTIGLLLLVTLTGIERRNCF